jgi:hypothetical protein
MIVNNIKNTEITAMEKQQHVLCIVELHFTVNNKNNEIVVITEMQQCVPFSTAVDLRNICNTYTSSIIITA